MSVCIRLCPALLLLAALAGCADPLVNERFQAQQEIGTASVEGEALKANIEPGATPLIDPTPSNCGFSTRFHVVAPYRLRFRPSGPTPTVVFEHGDRDEINVEAIFQNTFSDGRFLPTVRSLSSSTCADTPGLGEVMLAPLELRSFEGTARTSCLRLSRCTRLKVEVLPPDGLGEVDGDELRVAIIGEVHGDEESFLAAVEAITAWEAHLLISVGNLTDNEGLPDIRRWGRIVDKVGMPVVAALGENEAKGGSFLPFHEVFGRSDFSFSVGDVQFLVMDTASAEFSDDQLAYWEATLEKSDDPIVIAISHVPPLDPAGFRDDGLISRTEAGRLLAILGEHDVSALFTGGVGTFVETRQAGVPVFSTGGGGAEIESGDEIGQHYLRVTIRPGETEAVTVTSSTF